MNTVDKHTQGICGNCGAGEGLHHYETRQCPKNGVEEWRDGKKQEWQETFFENRKWQQLIASAPDLLEALQQVVTCDTLSDHLKSVAQSAINKALNI